MHCAAIPCRELRLVPRRPDLRVSQGALQPGKISRKRLSRTATARVESGKSSHASASQATEHVRSNQETGKENLRVEARRELEGSDPSTILCEGEKKQWLVVTIPEVPVAGEACFLYLNRLQTDILRQKSVQLQFGFNRFGVLQLALTYAHCVIFTSSLKFYACTQDDAFFFCFLSFQTTYCFSYCWAWFLAYAVPHARTFQTHVFA